MNLRSHLATIFSALLIMALFSGCTSISTHPKSIDVANIPTACNFREHLKCISLTSRETVQDSYEGKFTRHWFKMSYIGQACEKEHGRTVGVLLEGLFAIPHYTAIAIGNSAFALAAPFVDTEHEDSQKNSLNNDENDTKTND